MAIPFSPFLWQIKTCSISVCLFTLSKPGDNTTSCTIQTSVIGLLDGVFLGSALLFRMIKFCCAEIAHIKHSLHCKEVLGLYTPSLSIFVKHGQENEQLNMSLKNQKFRSMIILVKYLDFCPSLVVSLLLSMRANFIVGFLTSTYSKIYISQYILIAEFSFAAESEIQPVNQGCRI